jgi:hypothetical protein
LDLQRVAVFRATIGVGPASIEVAFSDRNVFDCFAFKFGDLIVTRRPDYSFYVVEAGDRTHFWSRLDDVRVWPHAPLAPSIMAFLADNAVMNDFFLRGRYSALHAAVVRGGRGLAAILGTTTAGKTTTAIACMRRGMTFYSDERCVMLDGSVFPFPRALTMRAGGRRLLREDPSDGEPILNDVLRRTQDHDEVVIRPSALFPNRIGREPGPLRAVFFIDGIDERPGLREVASYDLIPRIAESMWTASVGLERVASIVSEFARVRCYRLRLGRPDATARLLARVIDPGASRRRDGESR